MVQIRDATPGPDDASVGEAAYRRLRADIVFGRVEPGCKLGLRAAGSGIPSFYTVCHLSFVCHDLLDPIVLFQQHGLTA